MQPKYSIIVPIYNSEAYLDECITSILSQTFQNFELILVNDGSKDRSKEICEKYKEQDSRIQAFHIENQGVSHARNYGLRFASGEYICFIDSDDTVNPKWLENFHKASQADMIIQGCSIIDPKIKLRKEVILPPSFTESDNRFNILCEIGTYLNNPWSKCYSSSIIRENKIIFWEKCSLNEDLIFVLNFLEKSTSLCTISTYDYNYNIGNSHLTKKYYNPLELLSWKQAVQENLLRLCKTPKNQLYRRVTTNEFSIFSWYFFLFYRRIKYKDRITIYKFFKSIRNDINIKEIEKNRRVFIFPINLWILDRLIAVLHNAFNIRNRIRRNK